MANIIKPKRSNTAAKVPNTTELTSGELGVNMADRKVYINNGTAVVQVGAGNLSGLGDVAIASPSNGQSLKYNSTTTKWENSTAGAGDVVGPASSTDNALVRFDGTTGKLLQNSTATLDDTGNMDTASVKADYFDLDTAASAPASAVGREAWDDGAGAPIVGLKGGNVTYYYGQQEFARVYNGSGVAMTKGQVVYIVGAQGNRIDVRLARANAESTSANTIGLVAEPIAVGAEGWVQTTGPLLKLDTSTLTAGQAIYLSPTTAGAYTTTKPVAPNHLVILGFVERVSATVGSIFLKIDNGYELDELHNVNISSPTGGQLLAYDQTNGYWKNLTLTDGTGISVTEAAGGAITVTNTAPDQTVTLTQGGATTITGTYPNFTISSVNTTYGAATSTALGLIELGSDTQQTVAANAVSATASRSYALQVNAAGQGVVNVPWTDTNSGGTVTSVGGTGTVSGLSLSGTVTTSGNLTLGGTLSVLPSNFASQTANTVLAAPSGAAGVPTFRAIVATDIPTLNQNTTGSSGSCTGNAATVTNGVYTNNGQRISGYKQFDNSNTGIANASGGLAALEAYGTGGAAFAAFHRPGVYAAYFGIDSDNVWKVGGWSMGANAYPILHSNNYTSYAPSLTGSGASGTWGINITGNAATATALQTARTIAMTGDVTYTSGSFNGSANVTGTSTLANSGVTAGTYTKVTVNAKGLTTSGTTLAASDIPDLTMAKLPGAAYKESVSCATTANITLSGTQTIDGIAVVAGNRVLVKNQTTASQNGIYVVAAGAWTRSLDADNASEIGAAVVNVDSGTANGGELWTTTFKTTDTLGTTAMNWYEVLYNTGSWGISITGSSASTTGNAATATTLQTARTINGVSFNGSANITVADATKLPLAGGTMTGAIAFAAGQTWPTFNQNTTGTAANVTGTVALANGGTGATTAAAARTNLGATTLGGNLYTLANVAAIAFPRFNADNTVSSLDAASFRTAIGAGTSSTTGTVTSVAVSGGTTGLTTSGGPITSSGTITLAGTLAVANGGTGATTAAAARTNLGAGTVSSVGGTGTVSGLSLSGTVTTSGNLTLGGTLSVTPSNFASQTANTVLAAPSGTAGVPTFRTLVDADIPALTLAKLPGAAYKQSVRCATTANLTATATTTTLTNSSTLAALVLDGITVATNDRVLVKNQTTAAQNGIYTVTNVGSASVAWVLTRTADADAADEIGAAVVNVDAGTANGGELWTTTFKITDTLGTTAMNWYEVLYNSGTWGISVSGSAATLTTARTIQTNLASTSSASFNGSANITPGVTGTLPIANGGTGATTAAAARTALGAGTVTSVGGTGTVSGLTLTGTVTSSGSLTLGGNLTIAADMIYDSFTATAAQTTFTTTNTYTSGKIEVFVNGVKMVNGSDVTVTSGTSVVMASGLPVGTRVDLVYPI